MIKETEQSGKPQSEKPTEIKDENVIGRQQKMQEAKEKRESEEVRRTTSRK